MAQKEVCDECEEEEALCECNICNLVFCNYCIDEHLENNHSEEIISEHKDEYITGF